jgi:type 1 fimbria pilin
VNQDQGVRYLLSDNYGLDPSLAKGVGISLSDSDSQQPMQFLSSPLAGQGMSRPLPAGRNAGWYRLDTSNASRCLPPAPAAPAYQFTVEKRLTATLQKLPGKTVAPGRVFATAYVIVKVQ